MNELDQFVKHTLKIKNYVRYTDDFIIISRNREYLSNLLGPIEQFLIKRLHLTLHPNKVEIRSFHGGIDFLGYVALPHHIRVRTKTKRRAFRKLHERVREYTQGDIREETLKGSLRSYVGVLSHANAHRLTQKLLNQFWFWMKE